MKNIMTLIAVLLLATSSFAAEITETDVKAFLVSWLTAQNTGSYSNYASMYAAKFQGVKRSGDHTSRFNHDTWLKDRKRMFKNKMNVTAANIRIQTMEASVIVQFEQNWESNGYKDKGDKQLYLVLEKNRLKIAREEMLASKVLAGKRMVLDSTNFPFAFAMAEGIVMENVDINPNIIKGKPRLSSREPFYTATASINTHLLPKNIQSLIGMPAKLYSANGVCESKINGFKYVVKDIPSAANKQRWIEKKTPDSQIVENILSEGNHHLVATTEKCTGDFAKQASLPESPIAVGQKVDKDLEIKVWSAFKALPLYKKTIKPYEKDIDVSSIRKFILTLNGKTSTWVSILVVAGNPYCGEEGGETLGALWEVVKSAHGYDLKEIRYLDDQIFDYVTDIDNDGIPDFHYKETVTGNDSKYFGLVRGNKSNKMGLHFEEAIDLRFEEAALNDTPC